MSDRPKPTGGTCPIIADTPETNKHVEMIQHFDPSSCRHVLMPWVRVDFARRLERERDEARRLAESYRNEAACMLGASPLLADRLPWEHKP